MIRLTRLNGDSFALNPDLIERIDAHPDTCITLVDDTKYIVREGMDEVLGAVVAYRAQIIALASQMSPEDPHPSPPSSRGDLQVVPFPVRKD